MEELNFAKQKREHIQNTYFEHLEAHFIKSYGTNSKDFKRVLKRISIRANERGLLESHYSFSNKYAGKRSNPERVKHLILSYYYGYHESDNERATKDEVSQSLMVLFKESVEQFVYQSEKKHIPKDDDLMMRARSRKKGKGRKNKS